MQCGDLCDECVMNPVSGTAECLSCNFTEIARRLKTIVNYVKNIYQVQDTF